MNVMRSYGRKVAILELRNWHQCQSCFAVARSLAHSRLGELDKFAEFCGGGHAAREALNFWSAGLLPKTVAILQHAFYT